MAKFSEEKGNFFALLDGTKIFYKVIGKGPLLVFNHGYGSSHKSLELVANYLKDKFTCLLYDQRGCGYSDKPNKLPYSKLLELFSIEQLAKDCFELIEGLNRIDFIKNEKEIFMYGHSMGGMITLMFMTNYENILKKAVIGSTTPKGLNGERINLLKELKEGKIDIDRNFYKQDATKGFNADFIKRNPQFIDQLIEDKLKLPKMATIALLENFLNNYDIRLRLKKIKIPVLILHGINDETIPIKCGEYLKKLIKNSQLIKIPNQKHEINREIPKLIANYIEKFLLNKDD
ncbi:MAG: alpha/beta fold hydrolase [Promethearchaeota archaeon]